MIPPELKDELERIPLRSLGRVAVEAAGRKWTWGEAAAEVRAGTEAGREIAAAFASIGAAYVASITVR